MLDLDVLTIFTLLVFMALTMVAFRDILISQKWLSITLIVYLLSGFLGVLVEVIDRSSIDSVWLEKNVDFELAQSLGLIAVLIIMPFMFLDGLWRIYRTRSSKPNEITELTVTEKQYKSILRNPTVKLIVDSTDSNK